MNLVAEFINKIPQNEVIAIYAAGLHGEYFKKYIEKNRPDIKIFCFFDTFKEGYFEELEIKSLSELPAYKDSFSLLLLATRRVTHELIQIFEFYDIPYLRMTEQVDNFVRYEKYIDRQKQALTVFKEDDDISLYNIVWNYWLGKEKNKLEDYVYQKHNISRSDIVLNYNKHYLEYINKDAIKTIIDGGFYNGSNAFAFKKHLKNLETIYAFEPMYEKFKHKDYDSFLQKENFVKIIPLGLWENSCEIEFCENVTAWQGSRIKGTRLWEKTRPSEIIIKIPVTSVDTYKNENNIEKIDFIKLDVEGAELPVLRGSINTIKKDRPQLAISIYHSPEDFVEIPLYLNSELENYTFKLGHYCHNSWETVLYAIPNELL